MEITERQWRNLNNKLNEITNKLVRIEKQIPQRQKKWLKFDECVPPISVCKDVSSMMTGNSTYDGFLGKLAEYYGCGEMSLVVDKTINPKYLAVYRPSLRQAASRTPTASRSTVLHEWFHHLVNLHVVVIDNEKAEKLADKYARIFMERSRS